MAGAAAQHLDGGTGVILLQGAEQRRKAEKIVGVIHNDGAAVLLQHIHSAGDGNIGNTGGYGIIRQAKGPSDGDGGQCIFDIEAALHGDAEIPSGIFIADGEGKAGGFLADVFHPKVAGGVIAADQDPFGMGLGGGVNFLEAVGAAADDGELAVFHQLQLALEVILEIFVLQRADVVLREIEEQPNGEGNAVDPLLLVRLGGDLHRQVADAVGQGIGEALLQFQAFRGGKVGFGAFAAGVHFHGGKDGGAVAEGGI